MSGLIGERGKATLYAFPTPSSTTPLANGFPFDAGTAMRLSSNLSVLANESCQHIVTTPLCDFSIETNALDVFGNIIPGDVSAPSSVPTDLWAQIPWGDRRWSRRFFYFGIADENDGSGNATLRPVQAMVDLTETLTGVGGSVDVYAALTQSADGSSLQAGTYLAFAHFLSATSSNQQVIFNLQPTAIFQDGTGRQVPCRKTSSYIQTGQMFSYVLPVYLWIGMRALTKGFNGGDLTTHRISAWEYRA